MNLISPIPKTGEIFIFRFPNPVSHSSVNLFNRFIIPGSDGIPLNFPNKKAGHLYPAFALNFNPVYCPLCAFLISSFMRM